MEVDHKYIHVDNQGRDVPPASVVMEEDLDQYEFDEAEITGHARMIFYHPDSENYVVVSRKSVNLCKRNVVKIMSFCRILKQMEQKISTLQWWLKYIILLVMDLVKCIYMVDKDSLLNMYQATGQLALLRAVLRLIMDQK